MENSTEKLSIETYRDEIVDKINKNPLVIISGQTGCGKTTKVPQFILDDALKRKQNCRILVTQPRKIAAITVANRVASERSCMLGSQVGYQIGLRKMVNRNNDLCTQITYCTTGVLLQKIIFDQGIDNYTHIILDEIHERDIDCDTVMALIRKRLFENSCPAKIILMSATINIERFSRYFTLKVVSTRYRTIEELKEEEAVYDIQRTKSKVIIQPKTIEIAPEKNKYKVDISYIDDFSYLRMGGKPIDFSFPNIDDSTMSMAAKLVAIYLRGKSEQKSVLVFLPGMYEIEAFYAVLASVSELKEKCLICVLHSSLPANDQREAFRPATLPKVILSTNIAESSVTIPNIGCVIDFCLTKSLVAANSPLSALKLEWITQHSGIQRAGRTGRVCNGKVFRLVTKSFYESLPEEISPEMERAPLECVILRMKQLSLGMAPHLIFKQMMSPPEDAKVFRTVLILKEVGALTLLDNTEKFNPIDGEITFAGRIMAALPVDVRIAKLVSFGYLFSVLSETIIIGAGLSVKNLFKNHFDEKLHDYTQKLFWANGSSCDSIAILNAYRFWQHAVERGDFRNKGDEQKFCNAFNFELNALHEMRSLIHEMEDRLKLLFIHSSGGVVWSQREKHFVIKVCIAGAFMPNFFMQRDCDNHDKREASKTLNMLDVYRTVYFRKMERDCVGELHVEQIKEKLVQVGIADSTDHIDVSFDASKMFVQFTDPNDLLDDDSYNLNHQQRKETKFAGKIPPQVFKGIFFRKHTVSRNRRYRKPYGPNQHVNTSICLNVLPTKYEEEKYAEEQGLGEFLGNVFHRKKHFISNPEKCIAPSYKTKSLIGIITHVNHCNSFFFQPRDASEIHLAEMTEKLIQEEYDVIENPSKGMHAIVYHENKCKRARIDRVNQCDTSAECYLIDYGNTIEISCSDLFTLDDEKMCEYFSLSENCLDCTLTAITPSCIKCPRGKWTAEAVDAFSKMVDGQVCEIEIFSALSDKISVILLVNGVNVNEEMMKQGYAVKCKEPFMSIIDHNERVNIQTCGSWISRKDEFKEKINRHMMSKPVKAPPKNECTRVINLEGPFSPLESKIHEITLQRHGSVSVSSQSVNCITLNDGLDSDFPRMYVATEILTNDHENSVILHNVTAMPNINGLPALLAMIFAPAVQFQRNASNAIVQIRFGLGANQSEKAIFKEHDCVLPVAFDAEQDIDDVNELRYYISQLYNEAFSISDIEKRDFKPDIKRLTMKIFGKHRESMHPSAECYNADEAWKFGADYERIFDRSSLEQPYEPNELDIE